MNRKYWIVVASKDQVEQGVANGFVQAGLGHVEPLTRMKAGDKVLFYSSKLAYNSEEKYQCFTAVGEIADNRIVQANAGNGFKPFRRRAFFKRCREVSIMPLISELSFIKNKAKWGMPFRFGTLEIPERDFLLISKQMVSIPELEAA